MHSSLYSLKPVSLKNSSSLFWIQHFFLNITSSGVFVARDCVVLFRRVFCSEQMKNSRTKLGLGYSYPFTWRVPPLPWFHSVLQWCFSSRSVLAVTVELWESWTPIGWVRIPLTSFSRWSWSIPSTRPSAATPIPSGSPSPFTSTERCVAWRQLGGRAEALARATNSTTPLVAHVVLPGEGAIPCSCTATANSCKHSSLIKLTWVVELNQCFCSFLLYVEKGGILQKFACFYILKVFFWKRNLVFVRILDHKPRMWWVLLLIRLKR